MQSALERRNEGWRRHEGSPDRGMIPVEGGEGSEEGEGDKELDRPLQRGESGHRLPRWAQMEEWTWGGAVSAGVERREAPRPRLQSAEGAEVFGGVGAALGDGEDVVDLESGFGGAAAAGLAGVAVALEDLETGADGDGARGVTARSSSRVMPRFSQRARSVQARRREPQRRE